MFMNKTYLHKSFQNSLEEIKALGINRATSNDPFALAYAVVGGRSNLRWWLIPLKNRRATVSGLALFQPYTSRSKIIKTISVNLSSLGLSFLWTRNKIYLSASRFFEPYFQGVKIYCAFFTGTDGPHRKTSIQVMNKNGDILGYAKVSNIENIKALIRTEAKALERISSLTLRSALTPRLIFSGPIGDTEVIITDSLKNVKSNSPNSLTTKHFKFLKELTLKTRSEETLSESLFLENIIKRYNALFNCLPEMWKERLKAAIDFITSEIKERNLKTTLSHGDFTPWNTFFVREKIYVFDWEHCSENYLPAYDLFHFLIQKGILVDRMSPGKIIRTIEKHKTLINELVELSGSEKVSLKLLFVAYVTDISLKYLISEEPDRLVHHVESHLGKTRLHLLEL